jgi:hypothetical protein
MHEVSTTLSITPLNTDYHYAECHLCQVSFMLCVANKPIIESVIMLSVIMLSVIMLSVIMLIAIILNVVAPGREHGS